MEVNSISEKRDRKRNSLEPIGCNGSKMILILLTENVALHVRPIAMNIRVSSLEFLFKTNLPMLELEEPIE